MADDDGAGSGREETERQQEDVGAETSCGHWGSLFELTGPRVLPKPRLTGSRSMAVVLQELFGLISRYYHENGDPTEEVLPGEVLDGETGGAVTLDRVIQVSIEPPISCPIDREFPGSPR